MADWLVVCLTCFIFPSIWNGWFAVDPVSDQRYPSSVKGFKIMNQLELSSSENPTALFLCEHPGRFAQEWLLRNPRGQVTMVSLPSKKSKSNSWSFSTNPNCHYIEMDIWDWLEDCGTIQHEFAFLDGYVWTEDPASWKTESTRLVNAVLQRIGNQVQALCLKTFQVSRGMFEGVSIPSMSWRWLSPIAANHCQSEIYLFAGRDKFGSAPCPLSKAMILDYSMLIRSRMRCLLAFFEWTCLRSGQRDLDHCVINPLQDDAAFKKARKFSSSIEGVNCWRSFDRNSLIYHFEPSSGFISGEMLPNASDELRYIGLRSASCGEFSQMRKLCEFSRWKGMATIHVIGLGFHLLTQALLIDL